jgi:hypothetical protein
VRPVRRLIALLLLALWLPATLHCDLETAGVQAASDNHCTDDACHTLEASALTAFALTKLVSSVTLSVVALLPTPLELPADSVRPERTDVPRELGRRWQFSRRAAPPARAPNALT